MSSFEQKYEVQKGRTVTCKMGVAHAGEKGITIKSFTGEEKNVQIIINGLVKSGTLKPVPLTDAEKKALLEAKKEAEARDKKEAKAKELAEKEAAEKEEEEAEAARKREAEVLEADFDDMNKDPMIQFAKDHEIELKGTLVDDIRAELKALQDSLTTKDPE